MPVTEKTEAQWLREGWTPEEISTFSKLGLVLANTGADALNDVQRDLIDKFVLQLHNRSKLGTRSDVTDFAVAVIEAGETS